MMKMGDHFVADVGDDHVIHMHRCKSEPKKYVTKKQTFVIADTVGFGESLFIDDELQSTMADEAIYHSALVHGAVAAGSKSPKDVLIIGGGEGCTIREVLKYNTIESVDQVDWDDELVAYFRSADGGRKWNGGAYEDPRVRVIFEDVFSCEEIYKKKYDLILVDLCDPDGETVALLKNLIMELRKQLKAGGVLLMNAGSVSCSETSKTNGASKEYCADLAEFFMETLEGLRTFSYRIFVPSFMEHWCLLGAIAGPNTTEYSERGRMIRLMDWRATVGSAYDPVFSKMNDRFFRQVADLELSWGC